MVMGKTVKGHILHNIKSCFLQFDRLYLYIQINIILGVSTNWKGCGSSHWLIWHGMIRLVIVIYMYGRLDESPALQVHIIMPTVANTQYVVF